MTLREFLGRPLGGIELETLLGCAAVLWALPLLVSPEAVWNVRAFQSYYDQTPHWVFSLPWAASGCSTLVGLCAYRHALPFSRWLRMAGSFTGLVTWGWLFLKSTLSVGIDTSFLGIYCLFMLASFRLFVANCRAWRPPPWATG